MKKRLSWEQLVGILKEGEARIPVSHITRVCTLDLVWMLGFLRNEDNTVTECVYQTAA